MARGRPTAFETLRDGIKAADLERFRPEYLSVVSLWIDYVPTDSNPADTPSRFHEMPRSEVIAAQKKLGRLVRAKVPDFADGQGNWRSFKDVAASVWGRSK